MTIHEALCSPSRQPIMTVCLILLSSLLVLIFASFRDGRSRQIRLLYVLGFTLCLIFFYLLMLDICWGIDTRDSSRPRPALLAAFGSLPAGAAAAFEILYGLVLIAAFRNLIRYRKSHPTFESIKETMDLLPAGIAYAKPDGMVVFSNLAMNGLSRALTGKSLTDLTVFRKSTSPENGAWITLPGGAAAWQLSSETLQVDGEPYIQQTATDISRQAAITRELEQKNAKLRDIHMRLDIYNRQADRIIIAQELLSARMTVHSEVGNVLLESRQYLKNPASFDEEKLLQALKNTNTYLLREYEEDDTARDALAYALETAETIGVDVAITGMIPAEEPFRGILAAAIRECASNTVKHADGDSLSVHIQNTEEEMVYTLRNNGKSPAEPIRESGGFLSLRSLVEQKNGTMQTDISPDFTVTIRLPRSV